ncbi:hypothetical protein M2164_000004 [Streptomyces sp. SAI-208]|uniref:hypothetical protein n=1 Tax=Streptomyces sp. SAI-208 TaxID=2940550 RepID=UPI0024755323|nr:hypothetical protein [Streptomyces sp. SAI-208]MDH6604371.1 hypothetical protein [Streptomyces sp. SAI-208]
MGPKNLSSSQARERLASVTTHAVDTVTDLMKTAGPGRHLITTAVRPSNAEPVIAYAWFDVFGEGADALWNGDFADTAAVTKVLALGFILAKGSVVLGTTSPTGEEAVRGWMVDGHALRPLTADQVREAFHEALGSDTPSVTYRTAFPVPASTPA